MNSSNASQQLKMAMIGESFYGTKAHVDQLASQVVAQIQRNPNVYAAKVVAEKAHEAELTPVQVDRLVEETNRTVVKDILLSNKKAQANLRVEKKEVKDILRGMNEGPKESSDEEEGPGAPLSSDNPKKTSLENAMGKQANVAMEDYMEPPALNPYLWGLQNEEEASEEDAPEEGPEGGFLYPMDEMEDEFEDQGSMGFPGNEPVRDNPHASGIFPSNSNTSLASMGWWNEMPSLAKESATKATTWGNDGFLQPEDYADLERDRYLGHVRDYMGLMKRAMLEGDPFHRLVEATLAVKGDQGTVSMLKQATSYLEHFQLLSEEEGDNWRYILDKKASMYPPALDRDALDMFKVADANPVPSSILNDDTKGYYKKINGGHVLVRKLREIHDCEHSFRLLKAHAGRGDLGDDVLKYVRKTQSLDGQLGKL